MRPTRAAGVLMLVAGLCGTPAAHAEPVAVCSVTDPRITEASGLVAGPDGYRVVGDGGQQVIVYRLDAACQVTGTTTAPVDPYDVEDLALGPDGALWLADIGDNNAVRPHIAVIVVPDEPGTVDAVVRRLAYPDGAHDAESMVVDDEGRVVIVTKTFSGLAGIYRSEPLDLAPAGNSDPQPLQKVGEIQLQQTGTGGGPVGPPLDNLMTTGAARCGDAIAVRTYTDVYVWEGSDPATAITATTPRLAALPAQQQGESVAFTTDCASLVVHSEGVGQPIHRVDVPEEPAEDAAPSPAGAVHDRAAQESAQRRTVWLLGGALAAAVGLLVVLARSRRQR